MADTRQRHDDITIAFIGFGEAAGAFASGWSPAPARMTAYDIKTQHSAAAGAEIAARCDRLRVTCCETTAAAVGAATAVFSLVTADQALAAARTTAPHLAPGQLYLDCNSCAPQTKQAAAAAIEQAGGRYVDVAVMAPVHPLRHRTPLLISGPHAQRACALLQRLDMVAEVAGDAVGAASANKLVRSIMVKGLEALTVECLVAGRILGVDDAVIASLEQTFPGFGWQERSARMLERVMVHGVRRSAEMSEAAAMVSGLGIASRMAAATAQWQADVGKLAIDVAAVDGTAAGSLRAARADAIVAALGLTPKQGQKPKTAE